MTLDTFTETIENNRKEAETLQNQWARRVKEIKGDENLSDTGKAQQIEIEHERFRNQASELREKEVRMTKAKIQELQRQIDSSTSTSSIDIIAFRDAQDRADRLTHDEAPRVLERAMRHGDKSLAHAIFRRATDSGWTDVANTFTEQNPELRGVARELATLHSFLEDQSFQRTMAFAILSARV